MREKPTGCALLADRHHGLTEGIRGLLETEFETVVMVADTASLLEAVGRLRPGVAIVDQSLAREEGMGWICEVRQRFPALKLIVLSVHDEPCMREAAIAAGADAFVLKRRIATDLLQVVDALRNEGETVGSPG